VKCLLTNAQSIVNKLPELHHAMYIECCDFIFIIETWLHADINSGLLDSQSAFSIVRRDRPQNKHGGVCAIVSKKWPVITVNLDDKYSDLEIVCFDVIRARPALRFFVIYRPPYSDDVAGNCVMMLTECIEHYTANDRVNIIVGDLNFPKIDWANSSSPNDKINKPFLDLIIEHGYIQLVDFPTHICDNVLDVILTDDEQIIYHVVPDLPLGNSDHVTVKFNIALNVENMNDSIKDSYYRWHDADYNAIHAYLDCYDWQSLFCFNPSALSMWTAFISVLREAVDLYVPFCVSKNYTAKCRRRHTAEMRRLRSKKLKLWHKLKSRPYDSHIRTEYRLSVCKWRETIRKHSLQTEENIIESNNLGAFYRHVNKRIAHRDDVGVIITGKGDALVDDRQKADAFNEYFASVGVADNHVMPHINRILEQHEALENICISESDVLYAIKRLKNNLSSGPDGFPPALFLRLKDSLATPLSFVLLNCCQ
jgi:hypothetical protein